MASDESSVLFDLPCCASFRGAFHMIVSPTKWMRALSVERKRANNALNVSGCQARVREVSYLRT